MSIGPFSREQISFKEKFRILEEIDMQHATEKIVDFFIRRNGEDPEDFKVKVVNVEPLLFDEDYGWHTAIAEGIIQDEDRDFPFTVHLLEDDVWTVTLEPIGLAARSLEKISLAPSPSYIESPVRRIVERYRRKKYLEDKPPKPFRKKPTLQIKEILGFPPYEERK